MRHVLMQRLIAGLCCFVAFLVMASVMAPATSQGEGHGVIDSGSTKGSTAGSTEGSTAGSTARSTEGSTEGGAWEPSSNAHDGLVELGSIEDRAYSIRIYSTDLGTRYSIYECETLQELGTLLSLAQVERFFPDLPLHRLLADDGSALMLAAPARGTSLDDSGR